MMMVWAGFGNIDAHAALIDEGHIGEAVQEYVHAIITDKAHEEEPHSERLSDAPESVNVSIIRVPGAPFNFAEAAQPEDVTLSLESSLEKQFSNRAIVRVTMADPTGKTHTIGVPVKIKIKKPVWVVKNRVRANQTLSKRDFKLETRDISMHYDTAVGKDRNLNSYVARVNLLPGQLLDARQIKTPADILRDDVVSIVIHTGKTKITVRGLALEEGNIGDTIRVRYQQDRRRSYRAKIIRPKTVLVNI